MADNITSKQLGNYRRQFVGYSNRLKEEAASVKSSQVAFSASLLREAARVDELLAKSKVGRSGTKEERQAKINQAYDTLKRENLGKKAMSRRGIRSTQADFVKRQELSNAAARLAYQNEKNAGLQKLRQFFYIDNQAKWRGSKSVEERNARIAARYGVDTIEEAYDKWKIENGLSGYSENANNSVQSILNTKYDQYSSFVMGWTSEEKNTLKNILSETDTDSPVWSYIRAINKKHGKK